MLPRNWTGWVIYVAGGLVAIVLGGIAFALFMLPRTDLKGEFERRLEAETGRAFTIAGDLRASFFPVLGFRADDVTVANVPGGISPHLAHAARVSAGVELWPLIFQRRVIVTRLVLMEPRVALEIAADGRPNWNLTPAAPPRPTPQTPEDGARLEDIVLRELRIDGGTISYRDARDGGTWQIDDPELRSSVESLDLPVRIEGALTYREERLNVDVTVSAPRRVLRSQTTPILALIESDVLTARLQGEAAGVGEWFVGEAEVSGADLRRMAVWLGAPLEGAGGALANFSAAGRLTTQQDRIAFQNATLSVDAAAGRGDFYLETQGERPSIGGRLELPTFDLNPFLVQPPARSPGGAAAASVAIASAPETQGVNMRRPWDTRPLDLSSLRSMDANFDLYTGRFRFQRIVADSASMNMALRNGYLAATIDRLALYGGSGRGRLEVDARTSNVRVVNEMNVTNVRAQDFLRDAVGFDGLEGPVSVQMSLRSQGANQDALVTSVDGRLMLSMQAGALKGVDLGGVARTIQNALSGELVNSNARTRFTNLTGAFAVADGVMASDAFTVQTSSLRIDGLGIIDLGERNLTMRITPREGGIAIPFVVRGPWARLEYASDLRGRERPAILARVRAVQAATPAASPATAAR